MAEHGHEPRVRFGAVYYRGGNNPPREDWERDYAQARADGHTLFRHWFAWNNIERSPGRFAWDDYDRHLDLAAKHGIATVIAEMLVDVPEWLIARLPEARVIGADGRPRSSEMHVSCATGGHFVLCLDHPQVRESSGNFLAELVGRYRGHPALFGYDLWNECTLYWHDRYCHCPATQAAFRQWLAARYGDIEALGERWGRRSLTSFDQVELPRRYGHFNESMDALRFYADANQRHLAWRADVVRRIDPNAVLVAHGNARNEVEMAVGGADDWRSAAHVRVFGYTFYYAHNVTPWLGVDATRSASGGRPFWRAEAIGDTDWLGRRVSDPPRLDRDRVADPESIRLDVLISLAGGANAFQNPRWRPLLDGPLFGAFGWYAMDGSVTPRSEAVAELARWAELPTTSPLWEAQPIRGDVGVLLLEDAQFQSFCFHGAPDVYADGFRGTYEALLAAGLQPDPVRLSQIDGYAVLFAPHAQALPAEACRRLQDWVKAGGTLVAEAGLGYFDDAHAFPVQPSRGWSEVLGCRQASVHFGPDRWNEQQVVTSHGPVPAAICRQTLEPTTGEPSGRFEDGSIAAVDHRSGRGRTRLIGAMPGYAYRRRPTVAAVQWFRSALDLAGREPLLEVSGQSDRATVVARLWAGPAGRKYLWLVNSSDRPVDVTVTFPVDEGLRAPVALRGEVSGVPAKPGRGSVRSIVGARDAVVAQLAGGSR